MLFLSLVTVLCAGVVYKSLTQGKPRDPPVRHADLCKIVPPKGATLASPYTGDCKNGLAEGYGRAVLWTNSKRGKKTHSVTFNGTFKRGIFTGKGTEQHFDGRTYSWFEGTFKKWRRWNGTLRSGITYASAVEQLKYAGGKATILAKATQSSEPTLQKNAASASNGEIEELLTQEQSTLVPLSTATDNTNTTESPNPPTQSDEGPSVIGAIFKAFAISLDRQIEEKVRDRIRQKVDDKLQQNGVAPSPQNTNQNSTTATSNDVANASPPQSNQSSTAPKVIWR